MKIDKFLKSSPLFHIYLLSEKVFSPFSQRLKEEELTFIQSMILSAIYFEEKTVNPNELATLLQSTPSNISHATRHLHQIGLVQKSINKNDARRIDLKLSAKGNRKVQRLISLYNQTQESFEEVMGEKVILSWNLKAKELIDLFKITIR